MMKRSINLKKSVIDSILIYAKANHPKESILLLKGKVYKHEIVVEEVEIPPLSVHGYNFSVIPLNKLPLDFSVVGIAHSHPSSILRPSIKDLNNFYGRIMVITAFPYTEQDLAVFDRKGTQVKHSINGS